MQRTAPLKEPVSMVRLPSLLVLLFTLLFTTTAQAGWFDERSGEQTFLPVNQAFQASAWRENGRLHVGFEAVEGYYLYRHRFSVESLESGVELGETQLPPGQFKSDEFLGDVYVFYDQVVLTVPYTGQPEEGLEVAVTFQGCADAGLCYPPERLEMSAFPGSPPIAFQNADTTDAPGSPQDAGNPELAERGSLATTLSEDAHYRNLLTELAPLAVLGLFFLAGLGLTFTPCVLPMIPILSSIIVGQQAGRGRALALSSSYVAGMAITYALAGVLMGLFGAGLNLQARLQSPWVLIPFAILFVLFALAMFGIFDLRLAPRLANRIDAWQSRLQRSGVPGLALAGALSVVVVSPCVSAPLAGALVFISTTGNALMGGAALLALALGMGVPLLLVGTFGASLLPRSGAWLNGVKAAFGVLLLAVAVWLVERLLPGPVSLLLWGGLAIGTALALGALTFNQRQGWPRVRQAAGIVLLSWGIALILGAAQGSENPFRPLAGLATTGNAERSPVFARVTTWAQLENELDVAARQGRPAFVDVTAEWCISCKIMERDVFPAPAVASELAGFHLIRADVTDTNDDSQALLDRFGLFGPPSLLFFSGSEELSRLRIQGEVDASELAPHLERVRRQFARTGQGV
ncbi:protein-disulfide reductase DsbD [Modicisalibacter xianhensis]|nr:protein-disulfide reductase DsbD [Halomonas xianhensis]